MNETHQHGNDVLLTDREWEVVALVTRGRSNQGIAQTLCISENTVHTHLSHIYEKLELHGKVELAVWYLGQHNELGPDG